MSASRYVDRLDTMGSMRFGSEGVEAVDCTVDDTVTARGLGDKGVDVDGGVDVDAVGMMELKELRFAGR